MRTVLILSLFLASPGTWAGDGSVTVPWIEFKSLYTEQIRQSLAPEDGTEKEEPVYSIDAAQYHLSLQDDTVQGLVALEGRVLKGEPEPVRAFGTDVAVTAIDLAEGATLVGDGEGYRLYFETEDRFRLTLRIAAPVREEHRSRLVSFHIPPAIRNAVDLELPADWRLLESPGMRQADGRYVFAPQERLSFRLAEVPEGLAEAPPVVDTFSEIALKGGRYLVTTWLGPVGGGAPHFVLRLPADARLVDTSLTAGWLQESAPGAFTVALPSDWDEVFQVRFELPAREAGVRMRLPFVEGNVGREGEFRVQQPEDGRITLAGAGYRRGLSLRHLPARLRQRLDEAGSYLRTPNSGELELMLTRFDAVETPQIVLDAVHFYTSFTDNGRALSTLCVALPPQAGDKLTLEAVPGAEIWSLRVNGEARQLYSQAGRDWVIPLDGHKTSKVELSYLAKGVPLGLEGRLEVVIPATGLAAHRLHATIGLAERVELVAMEGDLVPADQEGLPGLKALAGTAYHFTHPFYRGEALVAAAYYKEPVSAQQR